MENFIYCAMLVFKDDPTFKLTVLMLGDSFTLFKRSLASYFVEER